MYVVRNASTRQKNGTYIIDIRFDIRIYHFVIFNRFRLFLQCLPFYTPMYLMCIHSVSLLMQLRVCLRVL